MVVSSSSWEPGNSFGNSYDSIFRGMPDIHITHVFAGDDVAAFDTVERVFQISLRSLLNNLINRSTPSGREVFERRDSVPQPASRDAAGGHFDLLERSLEFARRNRFRAYWFARLGRGTIWSWSRWNSVALAEYVRACKPDILFLPLYYSIHMMRLGMRVAEIAEVPIVAYVSDDNYSLRQFSLSPLFWAERFQKRRYVRRFVGQCEKLYVITDMQQETYEAQLGIRCEVLTKCEDFARRPEGPPIGSDTDRPIVFTYAGNVGNGRWKSLAHIGRALEPVDSSERYAILRIYTSTPLTGRMRRALATSPHVELMDPVSASELGVIYDGSDVLVLAEPVSLKGRLSVRMSFSTKTVEYFHANRPILAFGHPSTALIQYLAENDAAQIATPKNVAAAVRLLVQDDARREALARNAWELGERNHDCERVRATLHSQLKEIVDRHKQQ